MNRNHINHSTILQKHHSTLPDPLQSKGNGTGQTNPCIYPQNSYHEDQNPSSCSWQSELSLPNQATAPIWLTDIVPKSQKSIEYERVKLGYQMIDVNDQRCTNPLINEWRNIKRKKVMELDGKGHQANHALRINYQSRTTLTFSYQWWECHFSLPSQQLP